MSWKNRDIRALSVLVAATVLALFGLLVVVTGIAYAANDVPNPDTHQILPTAQLYALIGGALVPAVTYLLNHYGVWVSEPIKSLMLVLTSSIAGTLGGLVESGEIGTFNETLQLCASGVVAAFTAHQFFWRPSGLATKFKAGTNHGDSPQG